MTQVKLVKLYYTPVTIVLLIKYSETKIVLSIFDAH